MSVRHSVGVRIELDSGSGVGPDGSVTAPNGRRYHRTDRRLKRRECDTLVKGDGRSVSIAAASIIAKVTRDRLMRRLHDEHPGYNWCSNKGYGTPDHYSGLMAHGVDIMAAPGGFVSATHGGAEIEKTAHALRETVRALKAEREVKAA